MLKRLPKWLQVRRFSLTPYWPWCVFEKIEILTTLLFPLEVNALGEDIDATVITGKVIRPLRSVDPSQSEYQGLIEVIEEGLCLHINGRM